MIVVVVVVAIAIVIVCFEIAYLYVAQDGLKIHSDLAEGALAGSDMANIAHRVVLSHLFLSLSPRSVPLFGY